MHKRISSILCLALIFFVVLPCPAWGWSGKVVGVADGDTITVLYRGKQKRIRLYGIDCPERSQAFGTKAKQFTAEMVFGKKVKIQYMATDRYDRIVAKVFVGDFMLNEELLRAGLACVYTKYCERPICSKWKRLEVNASGARRGLWSDPNPIPPWEFRRYH